MFTLGTMALVVSFVLLGLLHLVCGKLFVGNSFAGKSESCQSFDKDSELCGKYFNKISALSKGNDVKIDVDYVQSTWQLQSHNPKR